MWIPVAVALLLTSSPLEEDLAFQEGQRLLSAFEYEKAVFRFREVTRSDRPPSDRAVAFAWLGLTYAKLGEKSAADEAFDGAVALDPLVALPSAAPPRVKEMLDEARKRARELREKPPTPPVPQTPPTPPPASVNPPPNGSATKGLSPEQAPKRSTGPSPLVFAGGGVSAVGLGALVGGGVFGVLALQSQETATTSLFQSDKIASNDAAGTQSLTANVLYVAGGVGVIAGAALVVMGLTSSNGSDSNGSEDAP